MLPSRSTLIALFAAPALLGVAGCGSTGGDEPSTSQKQAARNAASAKAAKVPETDGGPLVDGAVRLGLPSVVSVSVSSGGITRTGTGTLMDRATVLTDAGLITTPSGESAAGITVREGNGEEHPGVVDGVDRLTGLAALRVGDLTAVPPATIDRTPPAIGAPLVGLAFLGARRPAVRTGTVVTTGRAVRNEGSAEVGLFEATTSLGAQGYGGPIVDGRGRLVGVTTKGLASMVPGTVVAVPAATAARVAKALSEEGRVRRAYLGVETVGITPTRADELHLKTSSGAILRALAPGSPASFSTLRGPTSTTTIGGREIPMGSDVIVQINGKPVDEPEDIDAALATLAPGDKVTLKVIRGDESIDVHVTLSEH